MWKGKEMSLGRKRVKKGEKNLNKFPAIILTF